MAYTTTSRLQLQKAVIGSNQPFETASINGNWDKVDAEAVAVDARLDSVESINGTQATRLDAVEATNTSQGSAITALQTKTDSGVVYNSARIGGRTVFAQTATPTALAVGDIWIQV